VSVVAFTPQWARNFTTPSSCSRAVSVTLMKGESRDDDEILGTRIAKFCEITPPVGYISAHHYDQLRQ
jgi:hypothetical protein